MIPRKYKEQLQTIGTYADKLGLKAWVVGGAVRDFYLGKDTKDIDLTFEGCPESVAAFCIKKWGGQKKKFSQFGTYRVSLANGLKLDLVQARKESYPHPAVLPVVTPSTIKDDLFRRDFTANAWALSILPKTFGKSYDPFRAQASIDKGEIKILHEKSFLDDPTRLYRAARFAGRFGWKIERKTDALMRKASEDEYPLILSRERICQELLKILAEKNVKAIFTLMEEYGLGRFIYPQFTWHEEVAKGKEVDVKLGILTCKMGDSAEDFLHSLHLPRETVHNILGAWNLLDAEKSSTGYLTPLQTAVLKAVCPALKKTALEPCFVKGCELRNMGYSGRKISSSLEHLCKLQWAGKVTDREQALKSLESLE